MFAKFITNMFCFSYCTMIMSVIVCLKNKTCFHNPKH